MNEKPKPDNQLELMKGGVKPVRCDDQQDHADFSENRPRPVEMVTRPAAPQGSGGSKVTNSKENRNSGGGQNKKK